MFSARRRKHSLTECSDPIVAVKVGANYAGMSPIERYKVETLDGIARISDVSGTYNGCSAEDEACFSCRATAGAVS